MVFKKHIVGGIVVFMLVFVSVFVTSCTKNNFETSADAVIGTSVDTLRFDTVFVNSGSIIKQFKIRNSNNKKMLLNNIRLSGGVNSFFKMNVNGQSTFNASNIEIAKNDSIYIFIQVNINANLATLPFIVTDSILIDYNGKQQKVQLEAYGKNAIFIRNGIIKTAVNFTNTLPYVIIGSLLVDTFGSLNIAAGSRIFCHATGAVVVNGSLNIQGNNIDTASRVIFTGNRLDDDYKNLPASWPGIVFTKLSKNNIIKGAIIKNAYQALAVDEQGSAVTPKLILENTIIENAYDYGLLALNNSINASNCLIFNCGINIALLQGGSYSFEHCTSASINTNFILRRNPSLITTNFSGTTGAFISNPINANFKNCIFWGDMSSLVPDEIKIFKQGTASYNVNFNKCMYRNTNAISDAVFVGSVNNINPQFDSINVNKNYFNFLPKSTSPALNIGASTSLLSDLNNKNRTVGLPDIGCYERQ